MTTHDPGRRTSRRHGRPARRPRAVLGVSATLSLVAALAAC